MFCDCDSSWSSSILLFLLVSWTGYVLWLWLPGDLLYYSSFGVMDILCSVIVNLPGHLLYYSSSLCHRQAMFSDCDSSWSSYALLFLLVSWTFYVLWLWIFLVIFYTTLLLGVMDWLCSVIMTSWSSSVLLYLLVSWTGYVLWLWLFLVIFFTTFPIGVMKRLCSVIVTLPGHLLYYSLSWCHEQPMFCDCDSSWSSSILLFFWCHGQAMFCDCDFLVIFYTTLLLISSTFYVLWLWIFLVIFCTTLPFGVIDRLCSVTVTLPGHLLYYPSIWCHW